MNPGNPTSQREERCKASIGAYFRPIYLTAPESHIGGPTLPEMLDHDSVFANFHAINCVFQDEQFHTHEDAR